MSEQQEGWVGAWTVATRKDGQVVVGRFEGYLRSCSERTLRILCDWGRSDLPEHLVASVHFS